MSWLLDAPGGTGRKRRAAEERHLHVLREAMDAEEPAAFVAWSLDAVQRRVPFDRLAHARDGARDERVEAAPDVLLPARHGRDVGLHGSEGWSSSSSRPTRLKFRSSRHCLQALAFRSPVATVRRMCALEAARNQLRHQQRARELCTGLRCDTRGFGLRFGPERGEC